MMTNLLGLRRFCRFKKNSYHINRILTNSISRRTMILDRSKPSINNLRKIYSSSNHQPQGYQKDQKQGVEKNQIDRQQTHYHQSQYNQQYHQQFNQTPQHNQHYGQNQYFQQQYNQQTQFSQNQYHPNQRYSQNQPYHQQYDQNPYHQQHQFQKTRFQPNPQNYPFNTHQNPQNQRFNNQNFQPQSNHPYYSELSNRSLSDPTKVDSSKRPESHTSRFDHSKSLSKRRDEEKKLRRAGILSNQLFKSSNKKNVGSDLMMNDEKRKKKEKNRSIDHDNYSDVADGVGDGVGLNLKGDQIRRRGIGDRRGSSRKLDVPSVVTVSQLANLTNQKLHRLQSLMNSLGLLDTRPDRILTTDDASYLALESGFDPVVNDQASFDIYPDQKPKDPSNLPIRPPIVCIMGHVDHGKTTLLDSLRSTSIADLEAGGITQHIGAFEVSIKDLIKNFNKDSDNENNSAITTQSGSAATITFLDTPGHAAFSSMRSRGAMITDVAVIVVAGDDGVKTQTKEVIDLVRQSDVGIVVAITKCDKPGINLHRTRASIYEAGIEIESLGGEVPCVEVSALTGKGLAELAETIVTVAEFRDLRAETGNVRFEGRVIESDVGRGLGNVATVISLRGKLRVGLDIIAGQSYGRVRQLISVNGQSLESVMPGQPVQVTGWKNLPEAGSLVLGADSEDDAKRACENRIRRQKDQQLIQEIEVVNEKRALAKETFENNKSELEGLDRRSRIALIRDREKRELAESSERSKDLAKNPKELRLIIKSDYTGTVEAVKAAIESLDNQQVKVKIVSSGVGSITESDVGMAVATKGMIVGFNVKIDKGAYLMIGTHKVECKTETVIYRLIELVTNKLVEMLPKRYEERVIGEALISEIFEVSFKEAGKNKKKRVGGCKVVNGEIRRNNKVKVIRGQETIWKGFLEQLKHGKKDIKTSISKGTDCGLSFGDGDDQGLGLSRFEDRFEGFEVNDRVLSIEEVAIKRSLNDGL